MPLLVSLTLGLAPFTPQPHVVEKVRWLTEGKTLAAIDWFDLVMHGSPWVWLAVTIVGLAVKRGTNVSPSADQSAQPR